MTSNPRGTHVFNAPWGRQVKIATLFATVLLVTVAALPWILSEGNAGVPGVLASLITIGTLLGSAISGIRQYVVLADGIEVRRLGWTTRLTRAGLQGVEVAPGVMHGSLRVLGNGGVFGLTGRFRNSRLGPYRALVTDPNRTVVLHYDTQRVVVSPDRPGEFAQAVAAPSLTVDMSVGHWPDNGWKHLGWIALIPVLVFIGIGVLVYSETRPIDVQLDAGRLHVDGGFYEADVPLTSIQTVELRNSTPPTGRRTNGFAAGSARRGYFMLEGIGQARVFVDTAKGPYLLLRTTAGPIILNLSDASQTRELAERLALSTRGNESVDTNGR